MKLCTVCGTLTSGSGSRCSSHPSQSRRDPFYSSPEWVALSKSVIRAHVGQYGWVCPGDPPEHVPHPSRDLTTDHSQARAEGGAPLARANLRVLCRSWNSTLGARLGNALRGSGRPGGSTERTDDRGRRGGVPTRPTRPLESRASQSHAPMGNRDPL